MSVENQQTNLDNLKIDTIRKGTPKYRIKSYIYFVLVIAVLLLLFFLIGSIGNDFMGLLIFSIMMILPVLILFRNQLPGVIPSFLSDSIFEVDHKPDTKIQPYNISEKTKQYGKIFVMVILLLASIVLIADYRKTIDFDGNFIQNLGDPMSFFKIMGSLFCVIAAGIVLSDITGEEFSLGDKQMDEDARKAQLKDIEDN